MAAVLPTGVLIDAKPYLPRNRARRFRHFQPWGGGRRDAGQFFGWERVRRQLRFVQALRQTRVLPDESLRQSGRCAGR
jgi:hypothetical protein